MSNLLSGDKSASSLGKVIEILPFHIRETALYLSYQHLHSQFNGQRGVNNELPPFWAHEVGGI
jgi:hypothetical protein